MSTKFSAQEKLKIVNRALNGENISKLCQEYQISRTLIYRWIKRFKSAEADSHQPSARQVPLDLVYLIFRVILKHPEWGVAKIVDDLPKQPGGKPVVSYHGVQNVLERYGLASYQNRLLFQADPTSLKSFIANTEPKKTLEENLRPQERQQMIERVKAGEEVSKVCQAYGVSRTIFYRWLKRYDDAPDGHKLEALWDKQPEIERYYKQASEEYEQAVLSAVRHFPELSSHRLVWTLPQVGGRPILGNHGVQNILRRHNLSTYEQRLAFAEDYNKPTLASRFFGVFQGALSVLGNQDLSTRQRTVKATFGLSLGLFGGVVLFGAFELIKLIVTAGSLAFSIGMIFALIAFFFGMFFLAYSLKYYLTTALVLSYSRHFDEERDDSRSLEQKSTSFTSKLYKSFSSLGGSSGYAQGAGLNPDLSKIELDRQPFISIQLATYNEKRVVDRLLTAATSLDYENYEVILADDSNDETLEILKKWQSHPRVKIIHRETRAGYKGGALGFALQKIDPRAEFVIIFDADFIPYPDTITQFLKYFKLTVGSLDKAHLQKSNIAAVQGYQWHVLNKSENWITRGVRTEYSGSYVMERSGEEIYQGLKQISGSVYMIRADALKQIGWGTSLTEDFELTLKLYNQGFKVVFTPYIQAPAEAASTIKRLIRQRMRWAEGHSFNVKKMWAKLLFNKRLTKAEKFEFLYLIPYYLQAAFFIVGTLSWFLSETVFGVRLPFWTATWGWSLVFTNLLALPLMNLVGLFLEESDNKDYLGLFSFVALSYILAPFQAYAAIKGFIEKEEGPWFRTPKTGKITDVFTPSKFYKLIFGVFGKQVASAKAKSTVATQSLQPASFNQYLSLPTSNNQFNNFSIPYKGVRWVANAVLSFCLVITIMLVNLTPLIPFSNQKIKPSNQEYVLKPPSKELHLTADKTDFSSSERPTFNLTVDHKLLQSSPNRSILSYLPFGPKNVQAAESLIQPTIVFDGAKVDIPVEVTKSPINDNFQVTVTKPTMFKPGRYTLETKIEKNDRSYQTDQDFTWGVLALNTDKSIYQPGEDIHFRFSVLNDEGRPICNANLTLQITVPSQQKTFVLSNADPKSPIQIQSNFDDCSNKRVTNQPDYFATFTAFNQEEVYSLSLTAQTSNGTKTVTDEVEISSRSAFVVQRSAFPTRIVQQATYPVELTIQPLVDYQGEVTDFVPTELTIKNISQNGKLTTQTINQQKLQVIKWKVNFKQGQPVKLGYEITFPNVSPEFYLLGPLKIASTQTTALASPTPPFQEFRPWQIASDVVSAIWMAPFDDLELPANITPGYTDSNNGTITNETTTVKTGPASIKFNTSSPAVVSNITHKSVQGHTVLANAGRRISFDVNFASIPTHNTDIMDFLNLAETSTAFSFYILSTGAMKVVRNDGGLLGTGSAVLSTNTWYHICVTYTITNTATYTFKTFINNSSTADISVVNGLALNNTIGTSGDLNFGYVFSGTLDANQVSYWDNIYIDDSTANTDAGAVQVTAKLPNATSTNTFDTSIDGTTPTNRWDVVSERPASSVKGWKQVATAATTENYGIQAAATGDIDISSATIIARQAWIYASKGAASTCTASIYDNNAATSITLTTTISVFTLDTTSATYPSNPAAGMTSCGAGNAADAFLYEAGVAFAYTAASAVPENPYLLLLLSPFLGVGIKQFARHRRR